MAHNDGDDDGAGAVGGSVGVGGGGVSVGGGGFDGVDDVTSISNVTRSIYRKGYIETMKNKLSLFEHQCCQSYTSV